MRYWITLKLCKWEDITFEANAPFPPVRMRAPENEVGYIPIFKTKEAALEAVGGDENKIMEIWEV